MMGLTDEDWSRELLQELNLKTPSMPLEGEGGRFRGLSRIAQPTLPSRIGCGVGSVIHLQPFKDGSTVVGVDVSCRDLGATEGGVVFGCRGTVVWGGPQRYRYERYGPFIFHLTPQRLEIFTDRREFSYPHAFQPAESLADLGLMESALRLLEVKLKARLAEDMKGGIILWDGPLEGSKGRGGSSFEETILRRAREGGNAVIGITKDPKLEGGGSLLSASLRGGYVPPFLLRRADICSDWRLGSLEALGRVFYGRLAPRGIPLRVDVDRGLPFEDDVRGVERLLGNELMVQGYPETLRAAHILSVFTNPEVLALRLKIRHRYGVEAKWPWRPRRLLFGPYGRWNGS